MRAAVKGGRANVKFEDQWISVEFHILKPSLKIGGSPLNRV